MIGPARHGVSRASSLHGEPAARCNRARGLHAEARSRPRRYIDYRIERLGLCGQGCGGSGARCGHSSRGTAPLPFPPIRGPTSLGRPRPGADRPEAGPLGSAARQAVRAREVDSETGLTLHRARYYSPGLRRWTQEAPIGYGGGVNLYAYVGGAVLEGRDPSGLIRDCSGGACGNPHDWSGVLGLSADGSDASGFGGGVGSYIEDDGYLQDLMDAMYGAARGKQGCHGQVCAVDQEDYERYKESYLASRTVDEQRFPALAELLKPTRQLTSTEFAMLMGAAGIADATARQSLLDHLLVSGRVGSADEWAQ